MNQLTLHPNLHDRNQVPMDCLCVSAAGKVADAGVCLSPASAEVPYHEAMYYAVPLYRCEEISGDD